MHLLKFPLHLTFILQETDAISLCACSACGTSDRTHLHPIGPFCTKSVAFDPETKARCTCSISCKVSLAFLPEVPKACEDLILLSINIDTKHTFRRIRQVKQPSFVRSLLLSLGRSWAAPLLRFRAARLGAVGESPSDDSVAR